MPPSECIGLRGASERPWAPPFAMMVVNRLSITPTSRLRKTRATFADREMPRPLMPQTMATMRTVINPHGTLTLNWVCRKLEVKYPKAAKSIGPTMP